VYFCCLVDSVKMKKEQKLLEMLLNSTGPSMLPSSPGLQIYLRPCVTLTFDAVTQKVDRGPLVPNGIMISSFTVKILCSQVW